MRLFRFCQSITILALAALPSSAMAQSTSNVSDACAALDLLNRSLDRVLEARKDRPPVELANRESGLQLAHVYQLQLACLEGMHDLEAWHRIGRIPPLASSRPFEPGADDVTALARLMHKELKRPAWLLWLTRLPTEEAGFGGKTADDAFTEVLRLYARMNVLSKRRQVTPDELYAQLDRAITDAKAVLQHVDDAHRYRIDAPKTEAARSPEDIYAGCLAMRRTINRAKQEYHQPATPLPSGGYASHGEELFVQTQIILAELNLLKMGVGSSASTPLAVAASGKSWTDVANQVVMLEYLLRQVPGLRRMAEQQQYNP